ncbi:MAG: hypothetical protein ABH871_02035 [Pseudomonadota bacterium]
MKQKHKNCDDGQLLLDEAVDTFIQGAGKVSSALLGMINRIGGQIYALLFLSDEPQSLDEIGERLGVSKSNISINIRMLEEFNLVRKVWVKGSRKDYYAAERSYPKKVIKDFLDKIKGTLTDAITTVERTRAKATEARVTLSKESKAQAEFILQQVNLIGLFYYAADNFFENFFLGKPVNVDLLRNIILNPDDLGKKQ